MNVYRSTIWPEVTAQHRNAGRYHPDCDRDENSFPASPARGVITTLAGFFIRLPLFSLAPGIVLAPDYALCLWKR